jgi:hypothetical protein
MLPSSDGCGTCARGGPTDERPALRSFVCEFHYDCVAANLKLVATGGEQKKAFAQGD